MEIKANEKYRCPISMKISKKSSVLNILSDKNDIVTEGV